MEFANSAAFLREFKRLCGRYYSLEKDFVDLKNILQIQPRGTGGKHWNLLTETDAVAIFKTRIICLSLRRDAIRVVYAFHKQSDRIVFLEVYFKGDKENEDRERIREYIREQNS